MLGAETSQAERRNRNEKPVMLDFFLVGRGLDRVRVKSPNITGLLFSQFNLHHLDEPDGKTSVLSRGIETLEHFVSVSIRSFETKIISTSLCHHANAPLFSPMSITLRTTKLASSL